MNTKAVFVLLAFVLLFLAMVGGLIGSTDLTPDTLPASTTGGQVQGQQVVMGGVSTALCTSPYVVQTGDTLSNIASRCGVTLNDLVSANPQITNPNFIRVGQNLALPAPRSVKAVAATPEPTVSTISGVPPGTRLTVDVLNMPPNTPVKLGIGPAGGLYNVIGESLTGADGNLTTEIVIPESALPGETWTVIAITTTNPQQEFTSEPIAIGSKP